MNRLCVVSFLDVFLLVVSWLRQERQDFIRKRAEISERDFMATGTRSKTKLKHEDFGSKVSRMCLCILFCLQACVRDPCCCTVSRKGQSAP